MILPAFLPTVPGLVEKPPSRRDTAWREPTLATQFDWNADEPGAYTFFVQFIDRDLNYSASARAVLRVGTPWFANAWLMVPGGGAALGLVVFYGVAFADSPIAHNAAHDVRHVTVKPCH